MIEEKSLGSTLEEVRANLTNIEFDDPITILAGQPGIGKTTFIKNYMNNHPEIPDIGIATGRHNLLDEWETQITGLNHWRGFGKEKCNQFRHVKYLKDLGFMPVAICAIKGCDKGQCEYHKQFDETMRAGFPLEYLKTNYVDVFQILFVEESITKFETYKYHPEDYIIGLDAIESVLNSELVGIEGQLASFISEASGAIRDKNISWLKENIDNLEGLKNKALLKTLNENKYNAIKYIHFFNTNEIKGYLKNGKFYDYDKDVYYEPAIFKAFDHAFDDTKIVLSHAGFIKEVFEKLLVRYCRERNIPKQPNVKIYKSNIARKGTKIYGITKKAFSKHSFNKNYPMIEGCIRRLGNVYDDLCVITYSDLTEKYKGDETFMGLPADHFGNTSGLNKFEGKTLAVLSTFSFRPDQMIELHNALFNDNLTTNDPEFNEVQKRRDKNGVFPNYSDTKLGLIQRIIEAERYDAFHRSRGLLHDVEIYSLGLVPEKCAEEFSFESITSYESFYEELENKIEMRILEKSEDENMVRIFNIIQELQKGDSPTDVAKKLHLTKPEGGYDVQAVRGIKRIMERNVSLEGHTFTEMKVKSVSDNREATASLRAKNIRRKKTKKR